MQGHTFERLIASTGKKISYEVVQSMHHERVNIPVARSSLGFAATQEAALVGINYSLFAFPTCPLLASWQKAEAGWNPSYQKLPKAENSLLVTRTKN